MSALKKTQGINLVPTDRFASSTIGRFLMWLLSTFRIIVIIIEMLVMLAFFSRFWLDAKNSDLSDEMKQKKARILASQGVEKELIETQERLKIFSSLALPQLIPSETIKKIAPLIPPEVFLNDITLNGKVLSVTGKAISELDIMQTMVNLENEKSFKNINLNRITIDQDAGNILVFTINIDL